MRAKLGTQVSQARLAAMARYFFDLRSGDATSTDEEGVELSGFEAAHREAILALADSIRDEVLEGVLDQRFAVKVRDEVGSIFEIEGVFKCKILRKQ
jgi:Domain of unknown function (DUF6894)